MTADYDPLALPKQPAAALIHAENGVSDFALCGARLVWWEGPQPAPEHYPASTARRESVTCPACLNTVNASPAGGAGQ